MKSLIPFLLLLVGSKLTFAFSDFNLNCKNAYIDIICLRFNDAKIKITTEKIENPANAIPFLLDNSIDFLTVMIGEERKDFDKMHQKRDSRLQQLAKGDPSSPWYLFSQADVYLQSGFARIKFGEYLSAAIDINRAYRLFIENDRKFRSFLPNTIRLGLLHSLIGTVPDKYRWAVYALDFEGSISQGLHELTSSYNMCLKNRQYDFLLPESVFLLSFLSINLSGDKNTINLLCKEFEKPAIQQLVNNSPLLRYALVNLKIKSGKNDEAILLLTSYKKSSDRFPFLYLDYLLGVSKLNRLDNDAHLPLLNFVAEFRGMNYIRAAYEHLAWYYHIKGNTEKYNVYMERIKLRGGNSVDNDRLALVHSEKKKSPDTFLLKARLLFDGGYYEKSMNELEQFAASKSISKPQLRLEYTYRVARIYDETKMTDKAISWYEQTISSGSGNPSYYAANASLCLGLIYESRQQFQLASNYYQICLDMDFDEYYFSITQKAKSGMNRIINK